MRDSTDQLVLRGPLRPTDDGEAAEGAWETADGGATWRAIAAPDVAPAPPAGRPGQVQLATSDDGVVVSAPGRRPRRVYPQ